MPCWFKPAIIEMKRSAKIGLTLVIVAGAAAGYAAGKYAMWKQPVGTDANWCIALPPDGSARDFLALLSMGVGCSPTCFLGNDP